MPAHDQTYTAQFSINQYKVTFMSDGQIKKSETLDYGSVIVAPDDPIVEENTFQGWTPTLDANATVPAHDVIYTATFDRNEYYAAFIVDDEVKQNNQVTFGESITAPTVSEKTGYTFKGWQPAIPETMPAHDVSFTAKFEVNSYNVTWKVDDKTRVDQVTYNTAITKPIDPVKEGYTFADWDADIPELMPAGNLTFNAQFTVNSYKVKFIIDKNIDRLQEDLESLEPCERVRAITGLINYVLPKRQAMSVDSQIEAEYRSLEILMKRTPTEYIDKIADKVLLLQEMNGAERTGLSGVYKEQIIPRTIEEARKMLENE
jgi:hypothetical protein